MSDWEDSYIREGHYYDPLWNRVRNDHGQWCDVEVIESVKKGTKEYSYLYDFVRYWEMRKERFKK